MTRLLLDFANLAFRVHYASRDHRLTGPDGSDVTVAHGVVGGTLALARESQATHISVAIEGGGSHWREALHPGYKAGRREMEPDFRLMLTDAERLIGELGFAMHRVDGEEADDVLATLARQTVEGGARAVIATADRDIVGSIDQAVDLLWTGRGLSNLIRYTPELVRAEWGIGPERWAERKALVGDGSDAFRGCPGIGPRRAAELMTRFGSIAELRAALPTLMPLSLRTRLEAGWEELELGLALSTLRTDLSTGFDREAGALSLAASPEGIAALERRGLRSLAERVRKLVR